MGYFPAGEAEEMSVPCQVCWWSMVIMASACDDALYIAVTFKNYSCDPLLDILAMLNLPFCLLWFAQGMTMFPPSQLDPTEMYGGI